MRLFKKILLKIHQVTGIALSLMFLVWFVSGIVLIFAGFPHASRQDRFLFLKPFSPSDFEHILPLPDTIIGSVELDKLNDTPVYRITAGKKKQQVFDAATLLPIDSFSEKLCKQEAERFLGCSTLKSVNIEQLDQWMPWSYYQPLLPIYKFYMNDSRHTVLYMSSKTGTIVQQTDRKSRWLARIGAIPHWIYFRSLRLNVQLWNQMVIWISSIGLLTCLSGIIAGFIRLNKRRKQKKTGSITPYKKFWYKWHHLVGLFFGVFVFTFLLSGLFSVVDFPKGGTSPKQTFEPRKVWDKGEKVAVNAGHSFSELWQVLDNKNGVRKLEWETSMGTPAWFVYYDNYQVPQVYVATSDSIFKQKSYSLEQVKKRTEKLFDGTSYAISVQSEFDNYYQPSGMFGRPLPVYKISWTDEAQNLIYIDPVTGKVVTSLTRNRKIHRWLYQGLHKFNFQFLVEHNWLRKILLFILSLGGITVSFSGVVLSWKWIKRKAKRYNA
ncbi:PepSY domain-containing protein [Draconibacterium orientale]|uniref:PepSY domain-containing protein n=1 Tax=Draconibacterium orientale TaxID=1168034 RepID=UPI002A0A3283|nr:PepSY domain-containing protein [Draconibacterium orientale]